MIRNWFTKSLTIGLALIALMLTTHAITQAAGLDRADRYAPQVFDSPLPVTPTLKIEFTGVVEVIGADSWTVGGRVVAVDAETEIDTGIDVGDEVKVEAVLQPDGTLLAHEIELRHESIKFVGMVQAILSDTWTIDGRTVHVDGRTKIKGDIDVGDYVRVHAFEQSDGSLLAREIKLETKHVKFTGIVEAMEPMTWTISGKAVTIGPETQIEGDIQIGSRVKVDARLQADGTLLARKIKLELEKVEFIGVVESISDTSWTIGGRTVTVDADTEIEGDIQVGDRVKVEARMLADGSLLAHEIKLYYDKVKFSGVVESIGGDSWIIGGYTVAVDSNTEIDDGIDVGDRVKVEARLLPDNSLMAIKIRLAELPGDSDKVKFSGVVEAMGDVWMIGGQAVSVDAHTKIKGAIEIGDVVKVKASRQPDGSLLADQIKLAHGSNDEDKAPSPEESAKNREPKVKDRSDKPAKPEEVEKSVKIKDDKVKPDKPPKAKGKG